MWFWYKISRMKWKFSANTLKFACMNISMRDYSFSMYAKFSEKLTILNPWITRTCAYQWVRNVSFSQNFVYVPNEWSLNRFDLHQAFLIFTLNNPKHKSQPVITNSKLTIETQEQSVKNMLKVNNKDTRTTPWRRSGAFIVNFEHISYLILVFLLLTLSR